MKSTNMIDPNSVLYSVASSEVMKTLAGNPDLIDVSEVVYREMEAQPVQKIDVIAQIEANLKLIGERQARAGFLMREVAYLLKA